MRCAVARSMSVARSACIARCIFKMTRHGKNATSNPVYTSYEKRKDCVEGNYGSQRSRIGADSVKAFDACSLTNQRCIHPVVTPEGYLYDKEAILENILHQKQLISRRQKIYQQAISKGKQAEKRKCDEVEHANTVGKFLKSSSGTAVASSVNSHTGLPNNTIVAKMGGAPKLEIVPGQPVKSFWIPAQTPDSDDTSYCDAIHAAKIVQKPDETIRCPMSGKPLKMRDLIAVKFTTVLKSDEVADRQKAERGTANSQPMYKCPVTHDLFSNSTQCVVLRPSGLVIKQDAVEKILKLDGMRDPHTGTKLEAADIIPLQRGGTGFTAAVEDGKQLIPRIRRPAMPSA